MDAAGKRYIYYPSRTDTIRLWHIADCHVLNKASALKQLKKDVAEIAEDPCSFWTGGGDYCDFIGYRDNRFDPDCVADWVRIKDLGRLGEVGFKYIHKLFLPIAHKCLGLLEGNHERSYQLHMEQQDRMGWLCSELGVQNLHYCALVDIVFVRDSHIRKPKLSDKPPKKGDCWAQRLFLHHGAGYAQTPGGKLNKLIQFMQSFEADVYLIGHVHDQMGRRQPTLGANDPCTDIVQHERLGVISGSYLKTYSKGVTTYGEQRGYRPTNLGSAIVTFIPSKREKKGEI